MNTNLEMVFWILLIPFVQHYILRCSNFANQCTILFDDLRNIGINYGPLDSCTFSRMLLFGSPNFSDKLNSGIIYAVIRSIESTNGFSGFNGIFYFCFIFSGYFIFKLI